MVLIKACGIALLLFIVMIFSMNGPAILMTKHYKISHVSQPFRLLLKIIEYLLAGCLIAFVVTSPYIYYLLYRKIVEFVMPGEPFTLTVGLCAFFPFFLALLLFFFVREITRNFRT